MNPVLVWTPRAVQDLRDIYVTIGLDNISAAERLFAAIEERVQLLRGSPRMGIRRREIAPAARVLVEGVYLILYETHPDTDEGVLESIEIVRIVHGHRDLRQILE